MSKSFRYVSDFVFPSEAGYTGSAGRTMVKGYARGGHVKDVIRNERQELNRVEAKRRDAGQEVKRVQSEMRYDKNELKGMKTGGAVKSDMKQVGMIKNKGLLGVVNNKNPGETSKHTAPNLPGKKMAYKEGGACYAKGGKTKGMAKVGKVMGEYKEGKLHSGSKKGPEVTNRKQAVAIALSEARNAGAKIPKKAMGGTPDQVIRPAKPGIAPAPTSAMKKGGMAGCRKK
jgi:hypothetical protein